MVRKIEKVGFHQRRVKKPGMGMGIKQAGQLSTPFSYCASITRYQGEKYDEDDICTAADTFGHDSDLELRLNAYLAR
jgi:hypothetical protein